MSLAAYRVTDRLMRRHAGVRAAKPASKTFIPGAESVKALEGNSGVTVSGRGGAAPGGVIDRGAHGRDDPVNWEILIFPWVISGRKENRSPISNGGR